MGVNSSACCEIEDPGGEVYGATQHAKGILNEEEEEEEEEKDVRRRQP